MSKLIQISVKIDPKTLERIDIVASNERYWRRNAVINGILTAIVDGCPHEDIMKLVRYWRLAPDTMPTIKIQ